MAKPEMPEPTVRELQILKVLWDKGESSVHDVYLALRDELGIVQNTVQAFLRTMEAKGLVAHRTEGRTFLYRPRLERERAAKRRVSGVLESVFDGALDQLVAHALSVRAPSSAELARLREMLDELEEKQRMGKR